ncbi:hypothetical protein [Nonomuraea sp. B19D2]|uniref:hypothetical protein n=1 Tax=Nonomuraea sp. B19D2 TaxID=3159561 RepID=UPI0032DB41E2
MILDDDGDAWQHRYGGWACAEIGERYRNVSWDVLVREYGLARIIHDPSTAADAA